MPKLEGNIAIITGAGSGMGQVEALLFAREGAKVVVADKNPAAAEETLRRIQLEGGEAMVVRVDVSVEADVKNMVSKTMDKYKRIDILINNAGIFRANEIFNTSLAEFDELVSVNFKGPFLCCREVIPIMLRQKKGKIVNTASISAVKALPGAPAYCATKGATVNLTRALALDYAASGININVICPGFINTPMTRDLLADEMVKKGILLGIPAGRIGESEDVAQTALFLASEDANFLHGVVIPVDGGTLVK